MIAQLKDIRRIAIIDDNETQAASLGELVIDAGYEPRIVPGPFATVEALVDRIMGEADAAICDHRLSEHEFAHFPGAEAAAKLYEKRFPAVLVTQFLVIDADVSIRRWRPNVPAVVAREDTAANPDRIFEGLLACKRELAEGRPPQRQTQRCILTVAAAGHEDQPVIDVFISGWHPTQAVRLPLALVPEALRGAATPGEYLLARVNTGAEKHEELFFEDFAPAPAPIELAQILRPDAVRQLKQ